MGEGLLRHNLLGVPGYVVLAAEKPTLLTCVFSVTIGTEFVDPLRALVQVEGARGVLAAVVVVAVGRLLPFADVAVRLVEVVAKAHTMRVLWVEPVVGLSVGGSAVVARVVVLLSVVAVAARIVAVVAVVVATISVG